MKNLLCWIGLGLLLFCNAAPAHAEDLPSYDVDDLVFKAEAVVQGRITASRQAPYHQEIDFRVTRSLFGPVRANEMLSASELYIYLEQTSVPFSKEMFPPTSNLTVGDELVLFLFRTKQQRHLNAWRKENKWTVVTSGVRLLRGDKAHFFWQRMNPGYYVEDAGETPDFQREVASSVSRIGKLRDLLQKPDSPGDLPELLKWRDARQKLRDSRFFFSAFGAIFQAVDDKLNRIHALEIKKTP